MENFRILYIEDEIGIAMAIEDALKMSGFNVWHYVDGESGLEAALNDSFDLILLDIMLPGKNGTDLCREIRKSEIFTPIIMLTAKDQLHQKIAGLDTGADDYLTKPVEPLELIARVKSVIRRTQVYNEGARLTYRFADVFIDFKKRKLVKGGEERELSLKLFQLLEYLIENPNRLISRNELLDEVWGFESTPSTRTVDVHVGWLRKKIEDDPRRPKFIVTHFKQGYLFSP